MDRETATPDVEAIPGERARELVERYHETAAVSTHVYEFVWQHIAEAVGPFCTDPDGNVLMDFATHVGAAPLGYNNPHLLERMASFELVDPTKIAGQDFYVTAGPDSDLPGPGKLMDRLVEITGYGMDTVFLSNSGAEAVENAIKICYDHTGAGYGITFQGAFHGRTLGALSLNRSRAKYRRSFPEIGKVHDVPFCRDAGCDPSTCSCGFFTDGASQLRRMLDPDSGYVDPDDVAYVVLEPIQGEGGYHVPSEAFADEIARLQDEHGLPVVADEIQSGMGRTGEWWAVDHTPIDPHVITAAKGARVGATIAPQEVFPDKKGRLSSTWGSGDILASIQGVLTIDVIRDRDLLANAAEMGDRLVERLQSELPEAPVSEVRGRGLMVGVEFDGQERRDAVLEGAFERGLLTLGASNATIRLLPPLDVTEREVDLGVETLADAVAGA